MHIGYTLSCYGQNSHIYSTPITAARDEVRAVLKGRRFLINGDPLTEDEFRALAQFASKDIELGWDPNLEYLLEGMNLPQEDSKWI